MQKPIYAIGDIHGHHDKLAQLVLDIEKDGGPEAQIVFLGDYADRGPDSRGVLALLSEGRKAGRNWVFLKGNHDRMFEWFMEDAPRPDPHMMVELSWLHPRLGGDTTMASYGVDAGPRRRLRDVHTDARAAVPADHVAFLRDLRLSYETDDLFFCHAGIRPNVPLDQQDEEDLVWIRQEFHTHTTPHPKLIVHGHTPVDTVMHYGNRVNLDTGAGYGKPLSAAVFDQDGVWHLTPAGREILSPA